MSFFGMLFWIVVLWFVIRAWRRSHRCVAVSSGYAPRDYAPRDFAPRGDRDEYIDSLESRLTELEERLDFTERLLATKNGER